MYWTGSAASGKVLGRAWRKWGLALVVAPCLWAGTAVQARNADVPSAVVALAELPAEGRTTHRLILKGGPFPFSKDGTVFGNRERLLAPQARGYYREYTVKTPGSRDRGARRIVCGGKPPTEPAACYYSDDHYASFRRIQP